MDVSDLIQMSLNESERRVLRGGLTQWGGPAWCSDELAIAMDFESLADFEEQLDRLTEAVDAGHPLSRRDWRRVLLLAEITFISDVVGSGLDWWPVAGITDDETLHVLRALQRKIPRYSHPSYRSRLD